MTSVEKLALPVPYVASLIAASGGIIWYMATVKMELKLEISGLESKISLLSQEVHDKLGINGQPPKTSYAKSD